MDYDELIRMRNELSLISSETTTQENDSSSNLAQQAIKNVCPGVAITDTDFLSEKDLSPFEFCILYSVLRAYDDVRILFAAIYYEQHNTINIVRRSILTSVGQRIKEVLERLRAYESINPAIKVVVPFYAYSNTITGTIHQYEFALDMIEQMREEEGKVTDSLDLAFAKDPNRECYKALHNTRSVFEDLLKLSIDFNSEGQTEYEQAVLDEIVRRGYLPSDGKKAQGPNMYRKLLVGETIASAHNLSGGEKETPTINLVGVLYYMLFDSGIDNTTLTKLAHFAFNRDKEYKHPASSNSEYSYIAHPATRITCDYERLDYIKNTLLEYGYDEAEINRITAAIDSRGK